MEKRVVVLGCLILVTCLLNCVSVVGQPQPDAPTIDQPSAITYVVGTVGHNITWHPSSEMPDYYRIDVVNPIPGTTGEPGMPGGPPCPILPKANWTGGSITQSVDGWDVGAYYYTCSVFDEQGRSVSSTVTVTVSAGAEAHVPLVAGIGIAVVAVGVFAVIAFLKEKKLKRTV